MHKILYFNILVVFLSLSLSIFSQKKLSIVAYGATPNDSTDDQKAIENCIAAAKIKGKTVYIPKGKYRHSGLINLDGVSMKGACRDSSILIATELKSTIYIKGKGVVLSNFTHEVSKTIARDDKVEHGSISAWFASNFKIDNLYIYKSTNTGVFAFGSSYGKIKNCYINATNADAIHNTNGSHHITVTSNVIRNNGDDMVAVVSYGKEEFSHDIIIENNDCSANYWGRGISVVGGHTVKIQNNKISNSSGAGIIIACESAFKTKSVYDVIINNNSITNCGLVIPQTGILLSGENGNVNNTIIMNTSSTSNKYGNFKSEYDVTNTTFKCNIGFGR